MARRTNRSRRRGAGQLSSCESRQRWTGIADPLRTCRRPPQERTRKGYTYGRCLWGCCGREIANRSAFVSDPGDRDDHHADDQEHPGPPVAPRSVSSLADLAEPSLLAKVWRREKPSR
jgi:hypothetical protein